MALAIRFDGLISDGVVANYGELARLWRVSRARLSQSMLLVQLAPDIQVLFLPPTKLGREAVREKTRAPDCHGNRGDGSGKCGESFGNASFPL